MDSGGLTFTGAFEDRAIAAADGLALYARDYAPLLPETGLPVICLHGLTRNSADFEVVAPRIASLGRRVIAPDTRGRGRSADDPDPAHYAPPVYVQDVIAILEALEISQAVFVGTSMGGLVTMVLAAFAPERIAAAVLNDVGPALDPAGLARIGAYVGQGKPVADWAAAAEMVKAINGSAFPDREHDSAFWDAFARRLCRQRADGLIEAAYDENIALAFADPEVTPSFDMMPLFEQLAKKPVLTIRGEISDLLSPAGVARMQAIKPDMDYAEVPRVGHAPLLDEPQAWDALLEFLAKVP